jgi:NitT/TauT family transport system permease protein
LLDKVGRVLGLGTVGRIRHVLLPAALPGYLAGLKQGWAFSWRSLMAAELITYSPALGIGLGQQLNIGRELNAMDLVIASILLILTVGVAIELLVFAPLERRVLRTRGLTVAGSR